MKKSNVLFRTFLVGLFMFQVVTMHANVFDSWERLKNKVRVAGYKIQYFTPYVSVPLVGALVGKYIHKAVGAAAVSGYAGYSTLSGMQDIYRIKKKYEHKEQFENQWHKGLAQPVNFYFARWRQCSEGDGIYWTTAWQLNEDYKNVKATFLKDLYAGKFLVYNSQGQLIQLPTPQQVFTAIRAEIQELAQDRQILAPLTDVYYAIAQPEEFHPDVSYRKFLWPNYNAASKLYIELDVMMKRLKRLLDIVAELRTSVGGSGWPKL